jgi:hypothetical protein
MGGIEGSCEWFGVERQRLPGSFHNEGQDLTGLDGLFIQKDGEFAADESLGVAEHALVFAFPLAEPEDLQDPLAQLPEVLDIKFAFTLDGRVPAEDLLYLGFHFGFLYFGGSGEEPHIVPQPSGPVFELELVDPLLDLDREVLDEQVEVFDLDHGAIHN